MGCGSSKPDVTPNAVQQHDQGVDEEINHTLGTYLATLLEVNGVTKDIQAYVAALRSEGCDIPKDFAGLEIEELKEEPFAFKRLHLKKVALWRANEEKGGLQDDADDTKPVAVTTAPQTPPHPTTPQTTTSENVRGRCPVCNQDVYDTQPRLKDPSTGLYQHESCGAAPKSDGGLAHPSSSPSNNHASGVFNNRAIDAATTAEVRATATNSQVVADAKATAAAAAEAAHAEVAAIMAAADAAKATATAAAKEAQAEVAAIMAASGAAKAAAAAAAKEAQAEVAAIMAAADADRAKVIAEAKRQADAALVRAQADAAQIAATAAEAATVHTTTTTASDTDAEIVAPVAGSVPSRPLLPDGKHAMLSYQWNVQEEVKNIEEMMKNRNVKCWMDINGGMKNDIYDSMAEGVQDAACLICFMTQAYQDSVNCKLELKFAQQSGVPIIPVMMQADFAAKGWLAILTAGSIWTPMHDRATVPDGIDNLIIQVQYVLNGGDKIDTHSESSSDVGSAFDVGAWGDQMFSLEETRDELERLRDEVAPLVSKHSSAVVGALSPLPAMVPTLPRGLFVTTEMQSVLDAVLSDTSTPQIGFCGMGGIGKTTVSCWVTRDDAVRTKFGMVAWITLGQTPVLDSCMDLLHQQIEGTALSDGITLEQKHEFLQQAFLNKSVLLVLDDCWNADVAKHFSWIDQSTNSKILISSRVRDVLVGGEVLDVTIPSKADAVKMLLSTAGMDVDALKERSEVAHIAELCKQLPLTIGVAGKLIRQLAQGSTMSEVSDWTDVVTLLEEELDDPDGTMSIEESVIRASIKAIPKKIQKECTQLFTSFALIPEDTSVPLSVLGMVFDACEDPATDGKKPLSRLQVRRYLKVLIDRSLVIGTVDRPQLHDVMLDYVQKQLAGDRYKVAQRQLVEYFRGSDRSRATPTGKYILQCVKHHITESHDAIWESSEQATSWIEDHVAGVQDVIAASAATILPVQELAKQAEAAELWWKASLRWNAVGLMKRTETGDATESNAFFKLAINASAKAVGNKPNGSNRAGIGSEDGVASGVVFDDVVGAGFSQCALDMFDLSVLSNLLKAWDPSLLAEYGDRYRLVCTTETGQSRPLVVFGAMLSLDWFSAFLSGDQQRQADAAWKLLTCVLDLCNEKSSAHGHSTEEDRIAIQLAIYPLLLFQAGDAIINSPGFSWDSFGNGDILMEAYDRYGYEKHHAMTIELTGTDAHIWGGDAFILAVQYGRVDDARRMMDDQLAVFQTFSDHKASAGYVLTMVQILNYAPQLQHMLGLPQHVQQRFALAGLTFSNAEECLDQMTKPAQCIMYAALDHKGPGGGLLSLKRIVWHVKAMCILDLEVPEATAVAWLKSLPDNDAYYEYSMVYPTHDVGAVLNYYAACWIALAHEKVGLLDGAIRFADLQLEPDMLKGGLPLTKWPQVIALACKGRVLAKLNRHDEALVAFQAAIAVSRESYSLMEMFALRELANCTGGRTYGEAAVQAGKDLAVKLDTFKSRMTKAQFDVLTIAP